MDFTSPISSIIPSGHGVVLSVLARTERPLTGRGVAELTDGRLSQKGTNNVLRAMTDAGVVLVEEHAPAKLYRLNRDHLAAESIVALADLRARLLRELRAHLDQWNLPAAAAWLFGSAARGEARNHSDIDVLIVRPDGVDAGDPAWLAQVESLADDVHAWTGNPCSLLEYSDAEFTDLMAGPERLAEELCADGIPLAGDRQLRDRGPAAEARLVRRGEAQLTETSRK
jgi:predicted nucleotidyltransferase